MTPDYSLLSILLLLVSQCRSHSQNPTFTRKSSHEHEQRTGEPSSSLPWNSLRNSTGSLLADGQRDSRSRGNCVLHNHCRQHEYCACSTYCRNVYEQCKRKRDVNSIASEEEEERFRSQRDCAFRQQDSRQDHRCMDHSDCGCNRRCSCHRYCTEMFC